MTGKQMTAPAGAPVDDAKKWASIQWDRARSEVRRLQMRIAKAVKEDKWGRVKALQYMLTHSFYAKALAVKRVTSNKGKKTPGVTVCYGKAPEPDGKLFLACADVVIDHNLSGGYISPKRIVRCVP